MFKCTTICGHTNPECDLNEIFYGMQVKMDVYVDMILKKHLPYKNFTPDGWFC